MKLILTLILFLFTHFCFAQSDTTKTIFAKDNYKIQYPKSWRLDTSKIMGTDFFIFAPLENETDNFSENINVIIQDLRNQNIDLEKYKLITDNQINQFATDPKVFESAIIKENNNEYFRIVYAMTQGKARLKITSICLIKNDKAYLATFTTEFNKYGQYNKVGEEILSSFCLTK